MTTSMVNEQHLEKHIEKQMGCMAGFFQIFDRSQILTGKRVYSPKRLAYSSIGDTTSESEKSEPPSPAISKELTKVTKQGNAVPVTSPKSPLPLQIFELKHGSGKSSSSWKFCKETPRLSLDSRATTDANGGLHPKQIRTASILSPGNRCDSIASDVSDSSQQNRSPSVIARLMGLEPIQSSNISEPEKTPELRRSASESRVSRDLFQSRLSTDGTSFYQNQLSQQYFNNGMKESSQMNSDLRSQKNTKELPVKGTNFNSSAPWKTPQHRKNFFDSGDIFPEPKQSVSIYGEIEKRLRMRGIDEQTKDLETLKQILEALQLKGLLHSRRQSEQNHRNFVYDEHPIVMMKPSNRRILNRRNVNGTLPAVSPRPERNVRSPNRSGRSSSPTTRNEAGTRRVNSLVKHKPLAVETQRRVHDSVENRRVSPVQSPKPSPRRFNSDPISNRSPRMKKTENFHQKEKVKIIVMAEDESSSVSGSSFTTSTDTERSKNEEFKEGKNLLERCDKLLSSIAEMNSSELQPSPVSVLDSSFYKDESFTPSPVMTKRNMDFKDHSGGSEDDEIWTPDMSPIRSKFEEISSDDCDFIYISEILRASRYLPDDSDVFLLLEKQQYLKGNDTSKSSRLQRKLIFDTISEILDKNRRLPPWKSNNLPKPSFDKIWSEFQKMRENDSAAHEDIFEAICGVLKKDLTGDGWEDCPTEMSEMVLDIERLVFKDLISESIRDLATSESRTTLSRRKLVF